MRQWSDEEPRADMGASILTEYIHKGSTVPGAADRVQRTPQVTSRPECVRNDQTVRLHDGPALTRWPWGLPGFGTGGGLAARAGAWRVAAVRCRARIQDRRPGHARAYARLSDALREVVSLEGYSFGHIGNMR